MAAETFVVPTTARAASLLPSLVGDPFPIECAGVADSSSIVVTAAVLDLIRAHAATTYPSEAIGVLGGHGTRIAAATALANRSRRPGARAIVAPADLTAAVAELGRAGYEQVGVYHSHPDGVALPSSSDLRAVRSESVELIVSVTSNGASRVLAWFVRPGEPAQALHIDADTSARRR